MGVRSLRRHIRKTIGNDPSGWTPWRDGWNGEAEAAFIDPVHSGKARYGNSSTTGVRKRVSNWRSFRQGGPGAPLVLDDLNELANWACSEQGATTGQ